MANATAFVLPAILRQVITNAIFKLVVRYYGCLGVRGEIESLTR